MTKQLIITQNKKIIGAPKLANWIFSKENETWVHKDTPRKLSGNQLVAYKNTLKLTQQQKDILKNKELTIKQIALETNVSRSTIYKVLKLHLGYKSDFSLKKGNHYDEFSENK